MPDLDQYTLVSDASGDEELGAVAVMLIGTQTPTWKVAALLEAAPPEQLELWGGVVGALLLIALEGSGVVPWQIDNRSSRELYLRDHFSALGLTGPLTAVSQLLPIPVAPEFSRYHSRCHHAARWIRACGRKLLERHGEGTVGSVASNRWMLIDLRPVQRSRR